jgi:hypothetical protein
MDTFGDLFFVDDVEKNEGYESWYSLATNVPRIAQTDNERHRVCVFFIDEESANFANAKRRSGLHLDGEPKLNLENLLGLSMISYTSDDNVCEEEVVPERRRRES